LEKDEKGYSKEKEREVRGERKKITRVRE